MRYLAKQGSALKQAGLSEEEQLASFGVLRKSFEAPDSGVALRNVSMHMATAGGATDKKAALKEIGLKPEDVDMVGESFLDALAKLSEGIAEGTRKGSK